MSNSHTPEPWIAISNEFYWEIQTDQGQIGDLAASNFNGGNGEENARRIVACVNACEGVPNDALDGGWEAAGISAFAQSLEDSLADVTAQRDELLAALKYVIDICEDWAKFDPSTIDVLIAKCEVKNG